ncbi:hypothetical protein BU17DRAFT_68659 [Hysterangium stoloniferum]|nr:hypothetical protein BU17DRAFT_68659 [Hysterangium stoloniferum]
MEEQEKKPIGGGVLCGNTRLKEFKGVTKQHGPKRLRPMRPSRKSTRGGTALQDQVAPPSDLNEPKSVTAEACFSLRSAHKWGLTDSDIQDGSFTESTLPPAVELEYASDDQSKVQVVMVMDDLTPIIGKVQTEGRNAGREVSKGRLGIANSGLIKKFSGTGADLIICKNIIVPNSKPTREVSIDKVIESASGATASGDVVIQTGLVETSNESNHILQVL